MFFIIPAFTGLYLQAVYQWLSDVKEKAFLFNQSIFYTKKHWNKITIPFIIS